MSEQPRVRGLGGVFFKSADPAALAAWYRRHLGMGIGMDGFNGAAFFWNRADTGERAYSLWSPFAADTRYFAPSDRDFMLNLRVDDLDGVLADLRAEGCAVLDRREDLEQGRFGYVMDPEGRLIELWEPAADDPALALAP
jgi:catechol 2,3-dioxygenase-like lactoylglutathione lyase family enzyme